MGRQRSEPSRRLLVDWVAGGALAVLLALAAWALGPVPAHAAAEPPPDSSCRLCHVDSQEVVTLPSGESFPVTVDLPVLESSAHGAAAGEPVYCTSCHARRERYFYPHAPNPAQNYAAFVAELTQSCQGCHYPHLPFHDAEQMAQPPTCVDCHGSHDIARVEEMGAAMPPKCLACHTDQTPAWAAEFVTPRPGLGQGAEGYAGSTRCNGCHDDIYFTWHTTLHAQLIRNPATDPNALLGDFDQADPNRTFARDAVAFTIGNRWRQVYLTWAADGSSAATPVMTPITTTVEITGAEPLLPNTPITASSGVSLSAMMTQTVEMVAQPSASGARASAEQLVLLPAEWSVTRQAWEPIHGDGAAGEKWLPACGSCHVTGLNTATWGFTEFGVGCESCHGPAAAHAADPQTVKPYKRVDDQVCGACHSRGTSPEGLPYPATYRPGDTLADHFTFAQDAAFVWPDGSARRNHQQYMDWRLGNEMAEELRCTSCHRVHDPGAEPAQLQKPLNELCVECHDEQRALVRHTPFHERAMQQRTFLCSDCHMPEFAGDGETLYLHTHSFLQPNPQGSIDHGGLAAMPNACNRCHTTPAEDPAWAVQTVSFALLQATPSSSSFFGPGPTPTSPPPPTPVPSAGLPAEVDLTEPGLALRWTLLGIVGLLVAGIGWFIYLIVRTRGTSHA